MEITEITNLKENIKELIRLAPYCRVSSDSEDQLHSFVAQIRHYKDYELNHPECKLVDIYADEGITGTSLDKRSEMQRLIRDCKKGLIDRVITKSVSRFARNTAELLEIIRLFKELGVSVYFEKEGIDSDRLNSEMILTFPGMAAQQESISISENMRWSYKKRMESGEFNCCKTAYGYDMKDKKLVVNESEAKVIRRIFEMYLRGLGIVAITKILNDEKVPRRYGYEKWHMSTVKYMLNNERYIGDALLQKTYTTNTLPYKSRQNKGEKPMYYVENSNPSIIDRETFEKVKRIMGERESSVSVNKEKHLLNGIIRCQECGRAFRRQCINGKYYWICSGKATGTMTCSSRRVREEEIFESFGIMLDKLKYNRRELLGTVIVKIEKMKNAINGNNEKISDIDKSIADLAAQNLIITKMHTSGVLSPADFSSQTAEINSKITALRSERRKMLADDESDEILDDLKCLYDILEEYESDLNENEDIFKEIVEKITVNSNEKITFRLIGGLEFTEEICERGRCKSA